MDNTISKMVAATIGGLLVAFVGHFFGQNTALAVIGAWVLVLGLHIKD